MSSLEDVLKEAAKKTDMKIGVAEDILEKIQAFPTGNIAIDALTGIGGFPVGRLTEVYGFQSSGKALPLEELVLTPDRGYIAMGDIARGDRVVDPEGEESIVTGVFPQGVLPVYRLTFKDGTWAEASGDHLWDVWRKSNPRTRLPERRDGNCLSCGRVSVRARGLCGTCHSRNLKAGTLENYPKLGSREKEYGRQGNTYRRQIVTTDYLRERISSTNKDIGVQLPCVEQFDFDSQELPLDPYLVGLLLGDGSLTGGTPTLVCGDEDAEETLARVKVLLPSGVEISKAESVVTGYRLVSSLEKQQKLCADCGSSRPIVARGLCRSCYNRNNTKGTLSNFDFTVLARNPLQVELEKLDMCKHSWEKSVPEIYKYTTYKNRLALLQGLMDTDGGWEISRSSFSSCSKQLRDDVVWLARSVGLNVNLLKDKAAFYTYSGLTLPGRISYRCAISERKDIRVFRLERKLGPLRTSNVDGRRALVSVEYVGDKECQCISVSASSKLFMTRDFIPTHNTTSALQCIAELQKQIIAGGNGSTVKADDVIAYFDYEYALDLDYCKALGINAEHSSLLIIHPTCLEDGANLAKKLIETGRIRLLIWDSVAGAAPQAKLDNDVEKSLPALAARQYAVFLSSIVEPLHRNGTAAIFINHAMEAINMGGPAGYGPPQITTPGGRALKYYASLRLEFKVIGSTKSKFLDPITLEEKEQIQASNVRVKGVKNKVGSPNREAVVRVRYGKGFDNFWTALQILVAHGKIKTAAGYFYFHDVPNLVHDDMERAVTGMKRPFVRGEQNIFQFADERPDWRSKVIAFAELVVSQNKTLLIENEDSYSVDTDTGLITEDEPENVVNFIPTPLEDLQPEVKSVMDDLFS